MPSCHRKNEACSTARGTGMGQRYQITVYILYIIISNQQLLDYYAQNVIYVSEIVVNCHKCQGTLFIQHNLVVIFLNFLPA